MKITFDLTNDELRNALEVMRVIKDIGYEIYIVGGFVRDSIMGIPSSDIDLASNIPTEVLGDNFDIHSVGNSDQFGVNTISYFGHQFEIAQFRADIYTDKGKGASSTEITSSFKDDCSRRDFTINAMGVDYYGEVVDYFEGIEDIKYKRIKTVGDPHQRFSEDYARIIRMVRFAAVNDFEIDPFTAIAARTLSHKLNELPGERISKELIKMASYNGSIFANAISLMEYLGILNVILPEISNLKLFNQSKIHHPEGNVFEHTLAALRKNDEENYGVNLSTLFHDIGKLTSYKFEEGKHKFIKHELESKELILEISERLKFTTELTNCIVFCAENHMIIHHISDAKMSTIARLMESPYFNTLIKVTYADESSRIGLFDQEKWNKTVLETVEKLEKKFNTWKILTKIKSVVSGNKVMTLRNIKPGKEVGRIINEVVQWIIDENISLDSIEEIDNKIKEV